MASILIVGLSTRAIAESAVGAGYPIYTLDYFGDSDQRALAPGQSLMRDYGREYSVEALAQIGGRLAADGLVYLASLENYPEAVALLARGRALYGNPPAVLRAVRDWRQLRQAAQLDGFSAPRTLPAGEEAYAQPDGGWLVKPVRSGGGHNVRFWAGEPLDADCVLQRYISGTPVSALFAADGRHCSLLGMTEQLVGRPELGACEFRWCGNILPLELPADRRQRLRAAVTAMAAALTRRFGLRGLNGLDLILPDAGQPELLEVNPRYTGSMELIEHAGGPNLFRLHVEACEGRLAPAAEVTPPAGCWAKGIVFARRPVVMPDTGDWRARGRRDIPYAGDRIAAGHPICTVLARGPDRAACWQALVAAAEAVRRDAGEQAGG